MDRYSELVLEACEKVEYCFNTKYKLNKRNTTAMLTLFLGIGPYQISSTPDAPHNYQAVIDGVHCFYKKTNDKEVIVFYEAGIISLACHSAKYSFCLLCDILEYEMYIRKNNENEFSIDIQKYLDMLSREIENNHDELIAEDGSLDDFFKQKSLVFKSKYGYDFKLKDEYIKGRNLEIYNELLNKAVDVFKNMLTAYKNRPTGIFRSMLNIYKNKDGEYPIENLLMGTDNYIIRDSDYKEHNIRVVSDAIHYVYSETRDRDVIDLYEIGIQRVIKFANISCVGCITNYLGYEYDKKENGKNKFDFDFQKNLDIYADMIKHNKNKLTKESPDFNQCIAYDYEYWKDRGYRFNP